MEQKEMRDSETRQTGFRILSFFEKERRDVSADSGTSESGTGVWMRGGIR